MNGGEIGGSSGVAEEPTPQPALIKQPTSDAKRVADQVLNEILGKAGATATASVDVNVVKATLNQPQHLNGVEKQEITNPDLILVHVGGSSAEGRNPAPDTKGPPNTVVKQVADEVLNEITEKVEPSNIVSEQIACTEARVVKVAVSGDAKNRTPQFVSMERPSSTAQQVVGAVLKEIIANVEPSATASEVVSVVRAPRTQLQPQPEAHKLQITSPEPGTSITKLGGGDSGGEKSAPQSLSIRPSNRVAQQVAGEGLHNIVGKVERNGTASEVVSVATMSPKQQAEKEEITSPEAGAAKLIGRRSGGIIEKSIPQSASVEPPASVAQQVTHEILNEIIGNVKRSATTDEVVNVSKASNTYQSPRKSGEQQTVSLETSVAKLLQNEPTVTLLPDDPIALRLEADMRKAATEQDFSQLKVALEASNQSEITRQGLQALAGTVLSQRTGNEQKKTTSAHYSATQMTDPQSVASSAAIQLPDRSSVEHRYNTRGSTYDAPCKRKTGNDKREGGHSYRNGLNRPAYVPPKRTFVASKDFFSQGKKRRRNNAGENAPKIIYRCVQAKLPTRFEDCKRLPVAYAMDLNDIEQQGQAMYLLGIENAKARKGQKTRSRSPTVAHVSKTTAKKRRPKASLKANYILESELKNDTIQGAASRPIYEGPPDENLDGGWPPGWIKCIFRRQSGANVGSTYRQWYSPMTKKRFRAVVEVKRFIPLLVQCRGDEEAAWKRFKARDYVKEPNGLEQEKRAINLPTNAKKARKRGKSVFTPVPQSKRQPFSEYPVKHDITRAPGCSFCVDDDDFDWTLAPANDDSMIQIRDDKVTYFFLSILEAVSFYENMPKDLPLAKVRRRLILMPFDEWIPLCGMKWRKVTNNGEDAIWPENPSSSNLCIEIIKEDTLTGRRLMGFDSVRAAYEDWCRARTTSPRLRKKATSLEFFRKQYLSSKRSVDGLVWRALTKVEQLKVKQQRDALFVAKVNGGTKTSDLSKSFPPSAKQPLESSPGLNSRPKKKTVTETLVKATAQPKSVTGGGTTDSEYREKEQELSAQLVNAVVAPRNESDDMREKTQCDVKRPHESCEGAGSPPKKSKNAPRTKQSTAPVAPVEEGGKGQVPQIADVTTAPREESHEKEDNDPNCATYPLELSAGTASPAKSKIATEMKQSAVAAAQPTCVAGGIPPATLFEYKMRKPATWVVDAALEPRKVYKTGEIAARFAEKPVEPSMDTKSLPKSKAGTKQSTTVVATVSDAASVAAPLT